jgi:hypothetical protein
MYYVNESNMETCPQIQISIGNQQCLALIDTGCQCSIMSEELHNELKARGLDSLELHTERASKKCVYRQNQTS